MRIKTEELVKSVGKAYKAVGNNKIIPITQMFGIKLSEGKLVLCATDSFNYLYTQTVVDDTEEEMDVCVNADIFNKLITKFTCENTTIELKDNYLLVKGNGEYKLDLLLDEEGNAYNFPYKTAPDKVEVEEVETIKFKDLKAYGEKSLAQTMEEPTLIAYFTNGELGISTDRNIMTLLRKGITKKPLTLRSKFVDLLTDMKEKVKFANWTNETTGEVNLLVSDGETYIFSKVNGIVEDYPFEAINDLIINSEFTVKGKINVKELSNILERISLVVTPYDSNVIDLKLVNGELFISSVKSTGIESIKLSEADTAATWAGKIDIEMLKSQLSTFTNETIAIYLGNDTCVKLEENDVTKLVCLVEE